jgi:hypothetical protein
MKSRHHVPFVFWNEEEFDTSHFLCQIQQQEYFQLIPMMHGYIYHMSSNN